MEAALVELQDFRFAVSSNAIIFFISLEVRYFECGEAYTYAT